ncbi:hypothetical protein [Oligoflexus tunisiensis]|uniref:hypothetical protein n=1 Tax=Oligoflexus tunisiensis TaxID=708132 RepID=UPI00159F1336|nr:hypothetical protein [Oligoflexus tunisiensis]
MRKVHNYLNAALSLNNIAEMLQVSESYSDEEKSMIREELEMILRFLEKELQELKT